MSGVSVNVCVCVCVCLCVACQQLLSSKEVLMHGGLRQRQPLNKILENALPTVINIKCTRRRLMLFCSVLQPSSIRGLATPWTYFLHLSLSSVILTDSSTGSPVHVLMLSIHRFTIFFVYLVINPRQVTSTVAQDKYNFKSIKHLCGLNGQHRAVPLTCSQNVNGVNHLFIVSLRIRETLNLRLCPGTPICKVCSWQDTGIDCSAAPRIQNEQSYLCTAVAYSLHAILKRLWRLNQLTFLRFCR